VTPTPATSGLVLVDKPAGWTSHDVVGRLRRLAGTRRVGHAGTLDPMATGVLVLGVERATKLLGHLALHDKDYTATVRLGQTTLTDDAEGTVLTRTPAAGVSVEAVTAALATMVGEIDQVPSAVSAIKVNGQRAYARVRAGEDVTLPARRVTIARLAVTGYRPGGGTPESDTVESDTVESDTVDVDIEVTCSSGTYVRAIARDLGAALGVGGHLTALRRTRVGGYRIEACRTLDQLAELADPVGVPLDEAVATGFPRRDLDADHARVLAHGGRLSPAGIPGAYGAFDPDGHVIALVEERAGAGRALVVLNPAP
jgi:tRNA pseudouridine55 synthase